MKTAKERALEFAKEWFEGAPDNGETWCKVQSLARFIEQALKEQDKLTRHAIATKLSDPENDRGNMIPMRTAESIAMNTSAV